VLRRAAASLHEFIPVPAESREDVLGACVDGVVDGCQFFLALDDSSWIQVGLLGPA